MAFQRANSLSNLPSSYTIILSFSYEFFASEKVNLSSWTGATVSTSADFCYLLHLPDTLGSDREKSVDQILGALQICKNLHDSEIVQTW